MKIVDRITGSSNGTQEGVFITLAKMSIKYNYKKYLIKWKSAFKKIPKCYIEKKNIVKSSES